MTRTVALLLLIASGAGAQVTPWRAEELRKEAAAKMMARDPAVATALVSREICREQASIERYRQELRQEQEATRVSGVADLELRSELGHAIVDSRRAIADWTSLLRRRYRTKPARCEIIDRLFNCDAEDRQCIERRDRLELVWAYASLVITGHAD